MERKERIIYNLKLRKNLRSLQPNQIITLGNFAIRKKVKEGYDFLTKLQGDEEYTLMYDDFTYSDAFFQFKAAF